MEDCENISMEDCENISMEDCENIATSTDTEEESTEKTEKSTFKYKKNENGLLLTVHHTVKEDNKLVRLPLIVGCFSDCNKHFVTVDCRGNIFIFDLGKKKYWKLIEQIPRAHIIRNIPNQKDVYLVGTKNGNIYWLDVEKSAITFSDNYTDERIQNISFPGIPLTPFLAVIQTHRGAILLNLDTHEASHRLDFNQSKISLKYVTYVPNSDQIFTCFTNDSVHIWSGITLHTIRIHNPIRIRDRYLMTKEAQTIRLNDDNSDSSFVVNCDEVKEYSRGMINSYTFSPDGTVVCFTTLDNYLILLSAVNYAPLKIVKLMDASLQATWLFSKPNEQLLLCQTTKNQLLLVDVDNSGIKLTVEDSNCFRVGLSKDRQLLHSIRSSGEANIYSASNLIDCLKSTQNCVQLLRTAMAQPKQVSAGCFDNELRKVLTRSRLIPILREFGEYPEKYRNLIWVALLDIPCNKTKFMELVKMGTHPTAALFEKNLHLKDTTIRRNLVKIFSCLGHWTKVFGHSDFIPGFIFPFVKVFAKNLNVCFEIIATVLLNHCQLWFEFHPLEPLNYLGLCENVLNVFDPELGKFYTCICVTAKDFAWAMLATGFSEVLTDEGWLSLWDNVLSGPSYFLVFCVVAYNIIQREAILKITDKDELIEFFRDQNPIDMRKFINKANHLMEKCPPDIHPQLYMKEFAKLPKGVYPKFQNYPKKWVAKQESQMDAIRKEHETIDARIRNMEREEAVMLERLERGLRQEEHSKRMKEMQKQYEEILQREEERLACQRKILLLYQKELRQRKGQVLELIEKSSQRREQNLKETELLGLLKNIERGRERNEMDLRLAEDNIKEHELKLISTQYGIDDDLNLDNYKPMQQKFRKAIDRLCKERNQLSNELQDVLKDGVDKNIVNASNDLNQIEIALQVLENEVQNTLKGKL